MSTVFLTGGTGVVGSAIVRALLENSDARLVLLLRARSDDEARGRVDTLLRAWNLVEASQRIDGVRGDTSVPMFGLDAKHFDRMAAECSRIIHCAALVRMNLPLAEARAAAVTAADNVLGFARGSRRAGHLEKVEFLSTVGIGGTRQGVLPERLITEARGYHNTYEQAKAEAETLAARGMEEGLPITIHRPSMVVGDSRTGEIIRPQIFSHLVEFLSGRRTFGLFPAFGSVRLDIVPVDYVAAAVVWSSGQQHTGGRVLHLCSGPEESPSLDELQSRVRAAFVAAGLAVPRRISLPPWVLHAAIPVIRALLPAPGRRALSALPIFLAYLSSNQGFSNSETRRILDGADIRLPRVNSYLGKVLERYLRTRPLENKT